MLFFSLDFLFGACFLCLFKFMANNSFPQFESDSFQRYHNRLGDSLEFDNSYSKCQMCQLVYEGLNEEKILGSTK